MKENIIEKLEYHERHDDTRFDNLGRDVWGLRVLYAKHIPDEKDK
jgi:DNA-directed RNA polymerase delta subunit